MLPPTEEGQVSDCEDLFILTIAAGLSQCLIVDIWNDVMWSGLECIASKGLHRLDFECQEGEKFSVAPILKKAKSVTVWTITTKPLLLDCPNVSL